MLALTEKGDHLIRKIDSLEFSVFQADIERILENNSMYYKPREKYNNRDVFKSNIDRFGLHKAVIKEIGLLKYYYRKIRAYIRNRLR